MPYEHQLSKSLKKQRWKVKVWDREICEHPHVTIIHKTRRWRWGIRQRKFLEMIPDPKEVPNEILKELERSYRDICLGWNEIHPDDPVDVPPEPKEQPNEADEEEEEAEGAEQDEE